jgi:ATP-dependent exoDNAse (exonuclease V) beta subunit
VAAFGATDAPTDLALRLDYRISHILIDEFQDTSRAQFQLLEKLTAGWTEADGRTLFAVGDPMQSIYRFRQAEVALFDRLWTQGIGQLRLTPVTLTTNFRSAPPVVDWVNKTFAVLMPARSDAPSGAVPFAASTAFKDADPDAAEPFLHAFAEPARVDEACAIADIVQATLEQSATDTVGILVRTRHQARLLVPELRKRGIAFAGEGLEQPGQTSVEQDLLTLTRALTHAGDRTAWLALLRAPWCGLCLKDMAALCEQDWRRTVYELMHDVGLVARLSPDGQTRLQRFRSELETILPRIGRLPVRDVVEGAWQQLGGPATITDMRDLTLARRFFATLDLYDEGGSVAEAWRLHERLPERDDQSIPERIRVNLLTIFKAKGLEYDTVILPALDGTTRQDDKAVLAWYELPDSSGNMRYLMAPVEAAGDTGDAIHGLIRRFASEQARLEYDRLLYVAATRARKKLHLLFELRRNKAGDVLAPRKGSLLSRLWPVIANKYDAFIAPPGTEESREEWMQPKIRRLPIAPQLVSAPTRLPDSRSMLSSPAEADMTFDWAGSDAMRIGSVVHRCLQFIAEQQSSSSCDEESIRSMLQEEGIECAALGSAVAKVTNALALTLADPRGQWLVAAHRNAVCEYSLTTFKNGASHRLILDRSFICEAGNRWIIDYKSSTHEGGNLAGFIQSELQRYREQLLEYRDAMHRLEPERAIRVALYFPLLQVFSELTDLPACADTLELN